MSLMDALLLESVPLKTPDRSAIFVALRNDGVLGSGTAADPYDGSTWRGSSVSATAEIVLGTDVGITLQWNANTSIVTVTTKNSVAHGLNEGEWIDITGEQTGQFNGVVQVIKVLSTTKFMYRIDATTNPTGNSITFQARRTMNVTAPGHGLAALDIFELSGIGGDSQEHYNHLFVVDSVSGDSFTCQVEGGSAAPSGTGSCRKVIFQLYEICRTLPAHSSVFLGEGVFETVGNRGESAPSRAWHLEDGQRIVGSGIEVTTLKVIVPGVPLRYGNYCGIVGVNFYDPAEVPDGFEVADFTVDANMSAHPWGAPYSSLAKAAVQVIGRHIRIRRLRGKDCGTHVPGTECFPLSSGGQTSNFPTFVVNCVIDDCLMDLPSTNHVYSVTCIGMFSTTPPFHRASEIRNCVVDGRYPNGLPGIPLQLVGAIGKISAGVYQITTREPHWRTTDDNVVVTGMYFLSGTQLIKSLALNGVFPIVDFTSTTIHFRVPLDPEELPVPEPAVPAPDQPGNVYLVGYATIGASIQGAGIDGGVGGVCRNNRVYHATVGSYQDTWSSNDAIYRYNHYANVYSGIAHSLPGPTNVSPYATSGSAVAVGDTAVFTSDVPHYLLPAQAVRIESAAIASYNGDFEVVEVPASPSYNGSPTTFKYKFKGTPPTDPSGNSTWREYWRCRNIAIERNIIELAKTNESSGAASGITASGGTPDPSLYPRPFRRYLAKENIVRHFQGSSDPNRVNGMSPGDCDAGIIQDNIIEVTSLTPIETNRRLFPGANGTMAFLGNQRASGQPVNAYDFAKGAFVDDLFRTPIEDALTLGFL